MKYKVGDIVKDKYELYTLENCYMIYGIAMVYGKFNKIIQTQYLVGWLTSITQIQHYYKFNPYNYCLSKEEQMLIKVPPKKLQSMKLEAI